MRKDALKWAAVDRADAKKMQRDAEKQAEKQEKIKKIEEKKEIKQKENEHMEEWSRKK